MNKLPKDIKLLKRIGERLDSLMKDQYTSFEIRSNELYEYANRDKFVSSEFKNQIEFNRFLRKQHDDDILKQIIPNCRVDDTNKLSYQWYFRRKSPPKKEEKATKDNNIHFGDDLNIQNSHIESIASAQEIIISENTIKKKKSYDEIHKDYIKSKGLYPFNGSSDYFKDEEIQLIKKFGYWFEALCSGKLPVINYEQKKFKHLYNKIYAVINEYPPSSTTWWKDLTNKQKVWIRYVRFLETEKQKQFTKEKNINDQFIEFNNSEQEYNASSYKPIFNKKYYFKNIIGLTDSDKEIINKNFKYWKALFEKPFSNLNNIEKNLLKSLNNENGPSKKIESVFYFFFREIKRLNLKDTVSYKANTDTWYSNEMYKQQQKIMLSITNYNHKS